MHVKGGLDVRSGTDRIEDRSAPGEGGLPVSALTEAGAVPVSVTVPVPVRERRGRSVVVSRAGIYRRLLALSDAIATAIALSLAIQAPVSVNEVAGIILGTAGAIVLFKMAGLYDRDELVFRRSTLDEAPSLLQLTALLAVVALLIDPFLLSNNLAPSDVLTVWLAGFGLVSVMRRMARGLAKRITPMERCLVIGDVAHAERIAEKLESARVRACVAALLPITGDNIESLGGTERLRRTVNTLDIHRVIISPVSADYAAVANLIRAAKGVGVPVSMIPRMLEAVGSAVEFDDVHGMMLLGVRQFGLSRSSRALKRTFDLVGSCLAIAATAPLMVSLAIAIRLSGPGPVLFRQTRVGRDGQRFQMMKFRSMVHEADALKEELRRLNEAGDGLVKLSADPRVTRVGRFMRSSSLDELPQLFNVLKGDMSLVGPRPLVVDEDARILGHYRSRLHLTPGMTGPWQVLGSNRVPLDEMVGLDYLYVANWSLWTDVKVLARTVTQVLARRNV
jgi:exopolysaccharide biosynthesis polyprenyl glycosylphosphotransferase